MKEMTEYEKKELKKIKDYKAEEPSVVSKGFDILATPVTAIIQKVLPDSLFESALNAADWMAHSVTDTNDILRDGQVSDIETLRSKSLELSDSLADNVHNWAIGFGAAEGGAGGFLGFTALAVDIPFVISLALRTIRKIGLCYGYKCEDEVGRQMVLRILALAGSDEQKDKLVTIGVLQTLKVASKKSWKIVAGSAGGKAIQILSIKEIARQLGISITKRSIGKVVPLVGGVMGAALNADFIRDVGWAARRTFQEQWLFDNDKIDVLQEK